MDLVNEDSDERDHSDSGDVESQASKTTDTEDEEEEQEEMPLAAVQPYMFEPSLPEGQAANIVIPNTLQPGMPPLDDVNRLRNTDWCICGSCIPMSRTEECGCCKEYAKVVGRMDEEPAIKCITEHSDFSILCLHPAVLELAYYAYRERYGPAVRINNKRRYTAFRQFVRWCYRYLGKLKRVPLPSCVMAKVRNTFPSERYKGFEWAPNQA